MTGGEASVCATRGLKGVGKLRFGYGSWVGMTDWMITGGPWEESSEGRSHISQGSKVLLQTNFKEGDNILTPSSRHNLDRMYYIIQSPRFEFIIMSCSRTSWGVCVYGCDSRSARHMHCMLRFFFLTLCSSIDYKVEWNELPLWCLNLKLKGLNLYRHSKKRSNVAIHSRLMSLCTSLRRPVVHIEIEMKLLAAIRSDRRVPKGIDATWRWTGTTNPIMANW